MALTFNLKCPRRTHDVGLIDFRIKSSPRAVCDMLRQKVPRDDKSQARRAGRPVRNAATSLMVGDKRLTSGLSLIWAIRKIVGRKEKTCPLIDGKDPGSQRSETRVCLMNRVSALCRGH